MSNSIAIIEPTAKLSFRGRPLSGFGGDRGGTQKVRDQAARAAFRMASTLSSAWTLDCAG